MARGQDTGDHPNRQVGRQMTGSTRGPLPQNDEEAREWQALNESARARARGFVMTHKVYGTGGIKATHPAHNHNEHTQHTQATEWTSRMQLAEDMKWDRQRGD